MFGDSILDCHEGDKRIEAVLQHKLEEETPGARWSVYNEAHGGEYIGSNEGSPIGVSTPLFNTESSGKSFELVRRYPRVAAVIVNYGGNDSKVYPPATFRKRLEMLGSLLERMYPGAVLIFSTSMYLDPAHSGPYHIQTPQVAGWEDGGSRDDYLEPYNQEIRSFTAARGYRLADTFRRLKTQTERGLWDLRERGADGNGDPKDDAKHLGDRAWFDNIHPNDQGTAAIADGLVDALLRPAQSLPPLAEKLKANRRQE
jgi:lysophospholipase L1-like esterase